MFGDVSEYIAVLAKFDQNLMFVLVNAEQSGVTITETTSLDQTRPMCSINFENVEIPSSSVMIELDENLSQWEHVKNKALGFLSMEQVGGAQACLDMATLYAKERIQFGRPIGSFQAIQHICANMLVQLESAKSVAYSSVRVDESDKVVGEGVSKLKTPDKGYLVVTHYQRLLEYIKPDFVHVFVDGKIIETGGIELSDKLEQEGYESYL